ncbi:MAG: flagellar type III secretion system pore protein FliP [Gemmatimonadaceae bacterium]
MLSTLLGGLLATGFVLLLIGVGARFMRRLLPGLRAGGTGVPLQVVQRLALSPRQGVALVRVGERVVALSTGEGGVHRLFELDDADARRLVPQAAPVVDAVAAPVVDPLAVPVAEPVRGVAAALQGAEAFRAALARAATTATATATAAGHGDARRRFRALLLVAASLTMAPPLRAQAPVAADATVSPGYVQPRVQAPASPPRPAPAQAPRPVAAPGRTATATPNAVAGSAADIVTRLAPQMDLRMGNGAEGGLRLSGTVGVVVLMGLLTTLPMLVLMMTSFTRVFIVFQFVRQGLGTQTAPPSQLIAALALILTGFIMAPTLGEVNRTALQPWMDGQIPQVEMLRRGAEPLRAFMLRQVRPSDVRTFVRLSRQPMPARASDVPLVTLMAAFATSELRTAFSIGFMVFLPFIVIDFAVSSVLMSLGMFMLPPALISLPFKLLLFVLVDGWALIMQSLIASFH